MVKVTACPVGLAYESQGLCRRRRRELEWYTVL